MVKNIIKYNDLETNDCLKKLSVVGSLSALFSKSKVPFLHYRASEIIYCKVFEAKNVANYDVAVDVIYKNRGIGIKTFVKKGGYQFEKIAEFNKQQPLYTGLTEKKKISKISQFRNERLSLFKNGVQDKY